jgi:hypothetical protein
MQSKVWPFYLSGILNQPRQEIGGQVLLEDGLALVVEDVDKHASGVQVNATVKLVLSVVVHDSCPPE